MTPPLPEPVQMGIDALDREHDELLRLAMEVRSALFAGEPWTDVRPRILQFLQCASAHFEHEEFEMKRYDYPDLELHRSEHQRLTHSLSVLDDGRGDHSAAFELALVLHECIESHLRTFDAPAGRHIVAAKFRERIGFAARQSA